MAFRRPLIVIVNFIVLTAGVKIATADEPVPTPWPHQFHALLFMNYSGDLSMIDLWYDWINGRNFNIIQEQLGGITYDLEWNNGTSFIYSLDESKSCRSAQLEVGIFLFMTLLQISEYLFSCRIGNTFELGDGFGQFVSCFV